jgi:hypothetical protein
MHLDLSDDEAALMASTDNVRRDPPRDHNLMAKDVDEPHGNRQQRISGVAVAGRGLSLDGDGCGRSHFRHRDRFVAGTRQLLGPRLRLLRESGRQYALCGDQRADHRRRPVMQRRMNGRSAPPASAALTQALHDIVENDRYPFSPRIRTLRAILAKLRPEPVREPLPPPKVYAPPSKGRYRRRG